MNDGDFPLTDEEDDTFAEDEKLVIATEHCDWYISKLIIL